MTPTTCPLLIFHSSQLDPSHQKGFTKQALRQKTKTNQFCLSQTAKMMKDLEYLPYDKSVRELGIFSLVNRMLIKKVPSKNEENLLYFKSDNTGTGCPKDLWSLLLWLYSKYTWILSCSTYCREPLKQQWDWLDDLLSFLPALGFCNVLDEI